MKIKYKRFDHKEVYWQGLAHQAPDVLSVLLRQSDTQVCRQMVDKIPALASSPAA